MNNPLKIGIMKTRIPKNPDKLRSLSIEINKYHYGKTHKPVSKGKTYLLDGKIKLHKIGTSVNYKQEKIKGDLYSLEIPIKYTKSGVMGFESERVIYKSIFIRIILNDIRELVLEHIIKELNQYRKRADINYFNRFNNNRINLSFYTIPKDGINIVKKLILDGPNEELQLNMLFKD